MVTQVSNIKGRRRQRPPGPPPDDRSGDYQFGRALQALASVGTDDPDYAGVDLSEASVHAVLALGAYTRDLAGALRELAARPPGYPPDRLAELIGEMFSAANTARAAHHG